MGILEDLQALDPMADPSGNNWAGVGNEFGLPVGWENMEDPSGRQWAGAGVQPSRFALGPGYAPSPDEYSGGPPMTPEGLEYGGAATPTNWQDALGNSTTGGGFFTMDQGFANLGQDVPTAFEGGSALPSTNNWRLLPPDYRHPNFIMRNGRIIDRDSGDLRGPSVYGAGWRSGADMGYPAAYPVGGSVGNNSAAVGWPGSLGGWLSLGPATTS